MGKKSDKNVSRSPLLKHWTQKTAESNGSVFNASVHANAALSVRIKESCQGMTMEKFLSQTSLNSFLVF